MDNTVIAYRNASSSIISIFDGSYELLDCSSCEPLFAFGSS